MGGRAGIRWRGARLESRWARTPRRAAYPHGYAVVTRGAAHGPPWSPPGPIRGGEVASQCGRSGCGTLSTEVGIRSPNGVASTIQSGPPQPTNSTGYGTRRSPLGFSGNVPLTITATSLIVRVHTTEHSRTNSLEARRCGTQYPRLVPRGRGRRGRRDLGPDATGAWAVLGARRLPYRAGSITAPRRFWGATGLRPDGTADRRCRRRDGGPPRR